MSYTGNNRDGRIPVLIGSHLLFMSGQCCCTDTRTSSTNVFLFLCTLKWVVALGNVVVDESFEIATMRPEIPNSFTDLGRIYTLLPRYTAALRRIFFPSPMLSGGGR